MEWDGEHVKKIFYSAIHALPWAEASPLRQPNAVGHVP